MSVTVIVSEKEYHTALAEDRSMNSDGSGDRVIAQTIKKRP